MSSAVGGAILGAALCVTTAFADAPAAAPKWRAPRTADGHPDLQGTWTNATITPFERPEKYGERLELSPQEADELEHAEAAFNATADAPTDPFRVRRLYAWWLEQGMLRPRTAPTMA